MRIGLQFPALLLQHLIIPGEAQTPVLKLSEVVEVLHQVGQVLHLQMIRLKLLQILLPILLQGQVLSPSLFVQHLIIPGEAQTPVLKLSKVVEIFHHVSQVLHLQMIGLQFSKVVEIFHHVGQVLHLQMIRLKLLQFLLPILLQGQVLRLQLFLQHLIIPGEAQTPELKLSKVVEMLHHVGQVLHLQMIRLQLLQILLPILLQTDHRNTASNIPGGGTNSPGSR